MENIVGTIHGEVLQVQAAAAAILDQLDLLEQAAENAAPNLAIQVPDAVPNPGGGIENNNAEDGGADDFPYGQNYDVVGGGDVLEYGEEGGADDFPHDLQNDGGVGGEVAGHGGPGANNDVNELPVPPGDDEDDPEDNVEFGPDYPDAGEWFDDPKDPDFSLNNPHYNAFLG